MSLAQRTISAVSWNVVASIIKVVILFGRSILLSRWLPKTAFGIYATATSLVVVTAVFANFGMGGAFLHRAPETEDEEEAAAIHFTLKLLFTLAWAILLSVGALLFTEGLTRTALIALTIVNAGIELAQTPQLILRRRVVHRRLALLQTVNAFMTTAVALPLAWVVQQGNEVQATTFFPFLDMAREELALWSLLATDVVTLMLTLFFLYIWRPVWRPHLAWSGPVVRYYLNFGGKDVWNGLLLKSLNEVDDLWTRVYLGTVSLADYSRAYTFATYPRRVISAPLDNVVGGTYSELKGDRLRLSRAFFRSNALLIRAAFLVSGGLALVAPEFIRVFLTEKWITMLDTFRLMLVFALLDPIRNTIDNLFVAVGQPEEIGRGRAAQLATLVGGLYLMGPRLGTVGVALTVDLMLVVGIVILLWRARLYVDFSLRRLFLVPIAALVIGLLVGAALTRFSLVPNSDIVRGTVKGLSFLTVYTSILFALERNEFMELFLKPIFGNVLIAGRRMLPLQRHSDLDNG